MEWTIVLHSPRFFTGGLTDKLDEEVGAIAEKTGLKRWQVIGMLIRKYLFSLLRQKYMKARISCPDQSSTEYYSPDRQF